VLAQLIEQLKAEARFLRRNDHGLRASVLVQARIAAEERLQCLVEHDDLTALHNRRGSYCVPL
jgi:PleD family two-component response regulator